jgi:hypothetical protein
MSVAGLRRIYQYLLKPGQKQSPPLYELPPATTEDREINMLSLKNTAL